MKRKFLFVSVLISLFIIGCTSREEIKPEDENNNSNVGETRYITVNLMSSDAGDDLRANVVGPRVKPGYEDGDVSENKVTNARFYFFTENGAAANVKYLNGSYVNYFDWTPVSGDQYEDTNTGDDVESKLKATIVISTKNGDKLPQRIAVVLNPVNLSSASKSLSELKMEHADYADPSMTQEGKFVMFNSVYGNNGAEVCAVPIESKHLQKTVDGAKANPVKIYVERSVAKVRVSFKSSADALNNNGMLALENKDKEALTVGGEQVYLKIDGWGLSAETTDGLLVKKIDPTWTSDWWNGTYRSFWAINSSKAVNKYRIYSDINVPLNQALYTNENALDAVDHPLNRTKVVLKGTLCKADGSPFTIVRHVGSHFADTYSAEEDKNLPELKKNILSQLTTTGNNYYYDKTDGETTVRTQIGIDDLQIVTDQLSEKEDSEINCYVHAELTAAAAAKTWYNSSDPNVTTTVTPAHINDSLKEKVDKALVWRSGMTYYYYEIIHNGTGANATKGVVRNHIYDTKVTRIAGLGTPVYNPDEVVYPEKPDVNDHYIAAEINVLSWRVVDTEYDLEW